MVVAAKDWRLRRWRLWFLALSNALRLLKDSAVGTAAENKRGYAWRWPSEGTVEPGIIYLRVECLIVPDRLK